MNAAELPKSYRDDKELISLFDRKLIPITSIDSSFHIDFSTVKVLIHKLSSNTIKDRLKDGLEDVKELISMFNRKLIQITSILDTGSPDKQNPVQQPTKERWTWKDKQLQ